jgi:hypothetical protein
MSTTRGPPKDKDARMRSALRFLRSIGMSTEEQRRSEPALGVLAERQPNARVSGHTFVVNALFLIASQPMIF